MEKDGKHEMKTKILNDGRLLYVQIHSATTADPEAIKREGDFQQVEPEANSAIFSLQNEAHLNAVKHGWWGNDAKEDDRNFGELLMLIVSECSEALEEYRKGKGPTETYYSESADGSMKMEGIPSELADIVIRVLDLCGHYGIDLEKAISEKMAYNKTRPFRHGGKKC